MEGLVDLLPIGAASQSLGILSTLVMSTTLGLLIKKLDNDNDDKDNDAATLLLALANAFSTYTVAYSICEFHYIQALHHAALRQAFKARRYARNRTDEVSSSPGVDGGFATRGWASSSYSLELISPQSFSSDSPEERHDQFVDEVSNAFGRFNAMRQMARNTMWFSLFCLILAVAALSDP